MDERLLQFAALLYRGDAGDLAVARAALADPAAFAEEYADRVSYDYLDEDELPDGWRLVLDVGELGGWVWPVHCREPFDAAAEAVAGLAGNAGLSLGRDDLAAAYREADTSGFLYAAGRVVAESGFTLVGLDDDSDTYSLALMPAEVAAEARALAEAAGGTARPLA